MVPKLSGCLDARYLPGPTRAQRRRLGDAAAVQLGKMLGARVIAGASSAVKRAAAEAAGADAVFDTSRPWKDKAKALGGADGVQVVFDPVGGIATDSAFRTLGWGGRHLMIGFAGGEIHALRAIRGSRGVGTCSRHNRQGSPAVGLNHPHTTSRVNCAASPGSPLRPRKPPRAAISRTTVFSGGPAFGGFFLPGTDVQRRKQVSPKSNLTLARRLNTRKIGWTSSEARINEVKHQSESLRRLARSRLASRSGWRAVVPV